MILQIIANYLHGFIILNAALVNFFMDGVIEFLSWVLVTEFNRVVRI